MKKIFLFLAMLGFAGSSYAQLSDEEYAYVTMDLQGILNLSMTTDPTVNFAFKSIADYKNGITKFNATKLEVDATVAWDLYAYASSDYWVNVESYSTTAGQPQLPAEILEIQSATINATGAPANFDTQFKSLKGFQNSEIPIAGIPTVNTQFLAGTFGTAPGESYDPGSAAANPTTNQFRLHYRLVPGIPASFNNSTVPLAYPFYARPGYYYLEVIYALVEDL